MSLSAALATRALVASVALAAAAAPARAQTGRATRLLEVDVARGTQTRLDGGGDAQDAALDRMLGGAGGGSATDALAAIQRRLVADLRRERPRAPATLIVFLYPGRISAERLRELSEVFVDVELVVDPCDRAVCHEAIGRHVELVGRALGGVVRTTGSTRLVFKTVTFKALTPMHGQALEVHRLSAADCVAAGRRPGGGRALLDGLRRADADYEPLVTMAVARHAAARRVRLAAPPSVSRGPTSATVELRVRGDRGRAEQQVLDAMAAAAAALRESPATPPVTHVLVSLEVPMHGVKVRRFRSLGRPLIQYLDGQLDARALFASYIDEERPRAGATVLAFDEGEGDGEAAGGGADADPAEAIAAIAAQFGPLGACARAEVARDPRFAGVTLQLRWTAAGRAEQPQPREPALRGGALARCLAAAARELRLPRFEGAPRAVDFPILVRRAD